MKPTNENTGATKTVKFAKCALFALAIMSFGVQGSNAQTTLSGDHIITGNLDVGTGGALKNLNVSGNLTIGGNSEFPFQVNSDGRFLDVGSGLYVLGLDHGEGAAVWLDAEMYVGGVKYSLMASGDNNGSIGGGNFVILDETNQVYRFLINSSGDVGIGTVSPMALLDVNGSLNVAGMVSLAGGYAAGVGSLAAGQGSFSAAAQCYVFGRNNVVTGAENSSDWVDADPLFVIGNGSGDSGDPPEIQNRDALVVYKNGNVKISKRQGDILMGEFGNPEQ